MIMSILGISYIHNLRDSTESSVFVLSFHTYPKMESMLGHSLKSTNSVKYTTQHPKNVTSLAEKKKKSKQTKARNKCRVTLRGGMWKGRQLSNES